VSQARKSQEKASRHSKQSGLLYDGFLVCILFDPEDGDDMFLRNVENFTELRGVIFQKREFFIATAANASNLT
jgi:hypothetical protein